MPLVDLRSDTVTRPTAAMRAAMAIAEVGDDVFGEDPTIRTLEALAAELSGKEAALFVPSGTMANQIALAVHCRPGDAAIVEAGCHILNHEAGGAAALSGVTLLALPGEAGILDPAAVAAKIPAPDVHAAPVTLIAAEDTANVGGGTVYPLDRLDALGSLAAQRGIAAHLDGARVFNAVVASGIPLSRRVAAFDSVSFCLSKGLGAPVGSLLCGSRPFIEVARRTRKRFGGGMRQAGLLAAAGLWALQHHVARLADDHARARALHEALMAQGWRTRPVHTNMVYVVHPDTAGLEAALRAEGVLGFGQGRPALRLVTHLDVDDAGIAATIAAFDRLRRSALFVA